MRNLSKYLVIIAVSGSILAACGGDDATGDGGSDGAPAGDATRQETAGDAGAGDRAGDGAPGTAYKYIVIYDRETIVCSATTGPGADIDAVELHQGGSLVGVGKTGSAVFGQEQPAKCTTCGMSMSACTHAGTQAKAMNAEGPRNAKIYRSMTDTGYISLNTGALQIEIGDATGAGAGKTFKSGDQIKVWEVDQVYEGDTTYDVDNACSCLPEKYEVHAFVELNNPATSKKLMPGGIDSMNAAMCAGMSGTEMACGSATFTVP